MYDELSKLTYNEITKLAANPRAEIKNPVSKIPRACLEYNNYMNKLIAALNKPRGNAPDVKLNYTPPCIEYLLKNPIGKGQRNDTLAFLASFFRQTGMDEEQCEKTLIKWNDQMCSPPISDREVSITVQSVYHGNGKVGCAKAKILSKCNEDCKFKKKGI
jgi:DNA primase large subunit